MADQKYGSTVIRTRNAVLAILFVLPLLYFIAEYGVDYGVGFHVINQDYSVTFLQKLPRTANESQCTPLNRTDAQNYQLFKSRMDHIVHKARLPEEKELEDFLNFYGEYCNQEFQCLENVTRCPCIPAHLEGRGEFSEKTVPELEAIAHAHPEMEGGHWRPRDCVPLQRIAIIVPYRDRDVHRRLFLHHMIPFLQRQLIEFTIFIAEQFSPDIFNKAYVMNAAFLEVRKLGDFDCYFFHDVDTLPEDDRNFYTCGQSPRHLGAFINRVDYRPRVSFVGGGSVYTAKQFERTNGFSNKFYGWGAEDQDAYWRIVQAGMHIIRFPKAVGRYYIFEHERDAGNQYNAQRVKLLNERFKKVKQSPSARYVDTNDGLSTTIYNCSIEKTSLFTWIQVHLPPPPESYRFVANQFPQTQ